MYDVIIIGAGPVGLFSTFYSSLRGLKTLTLENTSNYGGQLISIYPEKNIYDIAGIKEIKAKDYIEELYKQYLPYKDINHILYNIEIINLKKLDSSYIIETNNGNFETKTILVASGNGCCTPRKLEVENASKCKNILYRIDTIDKYKGKNIAILGGGDSAIDIANMLVNYSNVYLIHRRTEFRAHEESINKYKLANGKILTPMNVESIIYDGNCKGINLINKETNERITIDTDYVFVSYGLLPTNNIFNNILNSDSLGIIVNQSYQTSLKGIYAVGNACSYIGKVKTIMSGLGEAVSAITSIHQYIYPSKNPTFYSSINKK